MGTTLEELIDAGLCARGSELHLTLKGRDWLRAMEDIETQEVADAGEAAADLILSTSGLIR